MLFRLGVLIASVAVLKSETGPFSGFQTSLVLEKRQYLVGEPIILTFRGQNLRAAPISISESDPYGKCSSYHFVFDPNNSSREPTSGPPCAHLFTIESFECLSGALNFAPGRNLERRVVTITVVAPHSSADLQATFGPYLEDLRTGSYERRREAAIAIATLPQPFLESSLLQMLSTSDLRVEATRGLRQLNSKTGRQAIFGLIRDAEGLTFDQRYALTALREMNDSTYAPALLALREHSLDRERKTELLVAAARLDAATTMPIVQTLWASSQESDRESAINALAATERPEALPQLIQGLKRPGFAGPRSRRPCSRISYTNIPHA